MQNVNKKKKMLINSLNDRPTSKQCTCTSALALSFMVFIEMVFVLSLDYFVLVLFLLK